MSGEPSPANGAAQVRRDGRHVNGAVAAAPGAGQVRTVHVRSLFPRISRRRPLGPRLLKERDYLSFWVSRWTGSFAAQIQSVAMGWQMYAIARLTHTVAESAFLVGMIGLAAFIPVFLLTLPAGETADRYDRKKVLLICLTGEILTVLTLAVASWKGWASVHLLLVVGFLFGASRAFFAPANTALGPMLVPRPLLPRAIAWNSLAWQTASIAGPAAGGFLVAISPAHAYFTTFGSTWSPGSRSS